MPVVGKPDLRSLTGRHPNRAAIRTAQLVPERSRVEALLVGGEAGIVMVVALALLAVFILLPICSLAGWTVDSRDPGFGLWPLTNAPAVD